MFDTLANLVPSDKDFPERTKRIDVLSRVLNGTIYDVLTNEFHEEYSGSGEYIPLKKRRPSVRNNLCRVVVQDSVALLFGGGHFPSIECGSADLRDTLLAIVKETALNRVMMEAAITGSTGSVALLVRVLKGRLFFSFFDTRYMTPTWTPEAPDTLLSVTERRKVRGDVLAAQGYAITADFLTADFWFQRIWNDTAETWFVPVPVSDPDAVGQVDNARTVHHDLGFVPMVWVRNLPGGDGIDGECTFRAAIETQVELEYLLSQNSRGLKYSADPTLLIKEPASSSDQPLGGGNALMVTKDGDARLLEINGTASAAVMHAAEAMRKIALESIHGNRADTDKMSAAQSGRAIELMHQPLIWLADNLRVSYGEEGLLKLMAMVVRIGQRTPLIVAGKAVQRFPSDVALSLRWPAWFSASESDKQTMAAALKTLRDAGLMSREMAVKVLSQIYDNEDVPAELAKIAADEMAADTRLVDQGAQVKATEVVPD